MLAEKYKAMKIGRDELAASHKSKTVVRAVRGSLTGETKEINLAGGRFSVVGELWVKNATLDVAFPHDFDPLNPSRYNDLHAEARGVIAELYLDLKPHLRKVLADKDRRPTFTKTVSFSFLFRLSAHPSVSD
jgi:hypothetical protein